MEELASKKTRQYRNLFNYSLQYTPFRWAQKLGLDHMHKNSLFQFSLSYILPALTSLLVLFISYFFVSYVNTTQFFLGYIVIVAFCAWVGGLPAGLIAIVILTIGAIGIFGQSFSSILSSITFLIGALCVSWIIDVSRKTREVQQLQQKEKTYATTFVDLHNAYTKSLDGIKERDEFLSIASHELKTPLTSMFFKLHSMLNNVQNVSLANFSIPELLESLENAEKQINSLTTRINDLLNLSLITTGRMQLGKVDTDLVTITKQVAENFSESLTHDGYTLTIQAPSSVVGHWDSQRIEQAISNLLSNAIKYGQHKPIVITVTKEGSFGKFTIEDQGIGIAKKEQQCIFDRFKRAKESEGYKKGLGVGLYITQQIVHAHKGNISLKSSVGKGTCFTMRLPIR